MAEAPLEELEDLVKPLAFIVIKQNRSKKHRSESYRSSMGKCLKTWTICEFKRAARKTANVVLGNAFSINVGVVVDTHVNAFIDLGSHVRKTTPTKLSETSYLFPQESWTDLSHLMIHHGRGPYKARFSKAPNDDLCQQYSRNCPCHKMRN